MLLFAGGEKIAERSEGADTFTPHQLLNIRLRCVTGYGCYGLTSIE